MDRHDTSARPSRRTFVRGLAIGGAAASLGWLREPAWAQTPPRRDQAGLSGTTFHLLLPLTDPGESPDPTHPPESGA